MKILNIQNVSKSYGQTKALNDVSFHVEQGSFVGLLGENGAGKSTLLNIIAGYIQQDQGSVYYNDYRLSESVKNKSELGIVFQNSVLDKNLSVLENLYVRGSLYSLNKSELKSRIEQLTQEFELEPILKQRYGTLSGGQRRKVDIARALIHQPKFLILDEPTTGLDPDIRKTVWDIMKRLRKKENLTILLTTHYMEETADCDQLIMLDHGEIIKEGTPNELKEMFSSKRLNLYTVDTSEVEKYCTRYNYTYKVEKDKVVVIIEDCYRGLDIALACKPFVSSFEIINGTLDDMFLKIKKGVA